MAIPVVLPKQGMTMEEGTLERWLAADGASVTVGQPLFEMSTEKIESEIEADATGTVVHLVAEGTTVPAGSVIGVILAPGEELTGDYAAVRRAYEQGAPTTPAAAKAPAEPTATRQGSGAFVPASPLARRLAAQHGVDLSSVRGSGPGGRIVKEDVEAAIAERGGGREPAAATGETQARVIPFRGMRRAIAERMTQSLREMAQVTLITEADVTDVERLCRDLSRRWRAERVVVTPAHAVVRAVALALRDHPRLNATLAGDDIRLNPSINVGFAVALDDGLIAPVVRDADRSTLKDIARVTEELAARARGGRLGPDDVTGGTFTVTSLALYDVDAFTPIVNPGQTAILGLGRIRDAAAFEGERVVKRRSMTLSLTFDHRVVDGAPAAQFLRRVRQLLERPEPLTEGST